MKNVFDFDYDKSIVSLSNSLLKHYGVAQTHPSLKILDDVLKDNYQNVILMILDGMGSKLLEDNLSENSFLRANKTGDIYSVFPPTTAAATIAYHSALTPYESGWMGWMCYYPAYGKIIENFNNIDFYSGAELDTPAPAATLIKYKSIYEKITERNKDVEYHKIFPAFEKDGCDTFEEMCVRIRKTACQSSKKKIISAYWTEPDHTAHHNGVSCEILKQTLEDLDRHIKEMMDGLKDTLLIISADHGLIDVEEICLNDYADLCRMLRFPPCFEARFLTFFVKDGLTHDFKKLFNDLFGKDFRLYEKDEFLRTGLLGRGKKHPCVDACVGDFVAVSISNKTLRYKGERAEKHMIADHAGISEAEMLIPLIIKGIK